ncbi:MAG: 4-hydroxy-3-methylbut-2-enyl diphosphate reductase [Bacteroidales bacterium]|nr:4-hydroxy-3-methylbut-2-enyl diphosphate reductase [Bacteroidales bacterium]
MMKIVIDNQSGFCFGVVRAIEMAEDVLNEGKSELYCLGEIVHNNAEVRRLNEQGMKTVSYDDIPNLQNKNILIRAHGEPPETYQMIEKYGLKLHDASCPVVLKLQTRIKKGFLEMQKVGGQVLIFGKKGHAEVNGLVGQTDGKAIVLESLEDIEFVDFSKASRLYAQTTQSVGEFNKLVESICQRYQDVSGKSFDFQSFDTVCRQVENRRPQLKKFAASHDVILFVSGKESSNGKYLYDVCKKVNPNTFFISNEEEIDVNSFCNKVESVGICGATSTPMWLMEKVADFVSKKCPDEL